MPIISWKMRHVGQVKYTVIGNAYKISIREPKWKKPPTQIRCRWENKIKTGFLGLCPSSNLLKMHHISEGGCVSVFRQRST